MIIHLESGACTSGINCVDLNQSAVVIQNGIAAKPVIHSSVQNAIYTCNQGLHVGKIGKLIRWLEVQHRASGGK